MRVLIVDDSVVYRSKIRAALSGLSWLEVIGVAGNGKIALEMLEQKTVDLVTLDMEMPVMDGILTLKEIKKRDPHVKVIVFSSVTTHGSEVTLEALASGADDFVPKLAGSEFSESPEVAIRKLLLPKIEQFLGKVSLEGIAKPAPFASPVGKLSGVPQKDLETFRPQAVVIASSTGGPSAHEVIFNSWKGRLSCPIFIAQHMPPIFTTAFAKRIFEYSGMACKEAVHGEEVKNQIYVAPGDFHMTLERRGDRVVTLLDKNPQRNSVRPAADPLFETASSVYGQKCLAVVLTGMGEDGLVGVKSIREAGGGVLIQNQETSVVFGMPGAVWSAGLFDAIEPLQQIRRILSRMVLS